MQWSTYVFLLLMYVSNLEPDVLPRERRRWRLYDILEALQALAVLRLLLVDDAQAEVDLTGLLEVGLHLHHLRECLLGMI